MRKAQKEEKARKIRNKQKRNQGRVRIPWMPTIVCPLCNTIYQDTPHESYDNGC